MRVPRLLLPVVAVGLSWAVAQDAERVDGARFGRFVTSNECARCHSNAPAAGALRDAQGRGVAPVDLWRGSMMANAARDPFFRAAMAAEAGALPGRRAEVEAKCLRCHAPMASDEIRRRAGEDAIGTDLFAIESPLTALARDGVSCSLCHQIVPEDFGKPASWSGGFVTGEDREIYGPHAEPYGTPMFGVVRYWPTQGMHVLRAELCATCHTLFVGEFPEQTPYLEWRNSAYHGKRTCQACHMPTTGEGGGELRTRIARDPDTSDFRQIDARAPVGRHLFVGGNTLLPAILRDHADELRVTAPREAFDGTIGHARAQLRERTATLEVSGTVIGREFTVRVRNLAGHKLPTAHPSRRVWLHVRVRAGDRVLFESGAYDARGRIVGGDGKPLPSEEAGGPVAPHATVVTAPEHVPVYEAVMKGADGKPVFLALRAAGYLKDNRLLPEGWRRDHPDAAATAPAGLGDDADFAAGGDTVLYQITVPDGVSAYVIDAELLYQPISARFAAELFAVDAPEVAAFRRMYEAADTRPEVVAKARMTVIR